MLCQSCTKVVPLNSGFCVECGSSLEGCEEAGEEEDTTQQQQDKLKLDAISANGEPYWSENVIKCFFNDLPYHFNMYLLDLICISVHV